jgi:prolyl oligopeptidase
MSLVLSSLPPTPIEPVTEVLHGVPITDPYRWLEEQNSPRTRKWLEEQITYGRTYLDAIPGRDRIRKRVAELLSVEVISKVRKVRNRYFYLKRSRHQEQPIIMMRCASSDKEVVLVDPSERGDRATTSVRILDVSKDGRLLAYGVSNAADSSCVVEFIDVDTMEVLRDCLPRSFEPQLMFASDGLGFYYSCKLEDTRRPYYRAVSWHKFGTQVDEDLQVFFAGESPDIRLEFLPTTGGSLAGYLVTRVEKSVTLSLFLQNLTNNTSATKILDHMRPLFRPFLVDDELFALTDWKAPNQRIVAINPGQPAHEDWADIIPECRHRLKDYAFAGRFICVGYVENASSRIEVFDRTGQKRGPVPCPPQGSVQFPWGPLDSETVLYNFSSFRCTPTIFSYDIPSAEQKVWAKARANVDPSSFEVEQVRYKSKDGTEIPMFLAVRKGYRSSGPLPTFLTAYGGFGASTTPQYNIYSTFLIERGFLFALANIRGGGEFGREWHNAGMRHNRQKTVDDFISAAEYLTARGYAVPGKLAIGGGSNAALLMAASFAQRPDLFRAVVCIGPLLDMLRYHLFDSAHFMIDEFGSSDNEDDFHCLRAYSPYHRVKDGVSYPAVMFVSGDEDTCCNPLHARKMTARLQASTSSGLPIVLDYRATWGHASVQPLTRRIDALTDRLAFICNELSVSE